MNKLSLMIFKNRKESGQQLSKKLEAYRNTDAIVLAIPRGGVEIGKIVSENLALSFDIILSKKIRHPIQKEFAIGAVSLTTRVLNDPIEATEDYIDKETHQIRQQLREKYKWYYESKPRPTLTDRSVIIVDDGAATGYTILSAIELIAQHHPKELVIAIPVASDQAIARLEKHPAVQQVVCVSIPKEFSSVGQFYDNFTQVTDAEVMEMLGGNGRMESSQR